MLDKFLKLIASCILRCPLQLLFVLVLFASCGTHKSATKSNSFAQSCEQTQMTDTTSVKQVKQSKGEEEITEVTTTTKTEYDTEKPVDPETGKPPIKSEETTTTKKETAKRTETSSETNINKGVSEDTNRNEQQASNSETEDEREESTQFKQIGWCAFALSFLALIIFYIVKKIKKTEGGYK
ncbi:hypothetical protein [Bacteroides fragilis]|uniref:hypothetical protein n=1 Tax=Bacteroides fragilis TaxID=817 RepID=UPI001C7000DC|nr:hypothetical protein [Bacteroides fragilis]MBW9276731.1 hypothetical protein [Bacteroides fragilis]